MEESPFACPICYEDYNKTSNVPTSFLCGHSCCLSHLSILQNCPICRATIAKQIDCKPNYALLDGAMLYFDLLAKRNVQTEINLSPENVAIDLGKTNGDHFPNIGLSDEDFAKLLDTELNGSPTSSPVKQCIIPLISSIRSMPIPPVRTVLTRAKTAKSILKLCQHRCNLFYDMCCSCSDGRPVEDHYPTYIDDIGWMNIGDRSDGYCSVCKDRF